jgi:hypothetical protein
LAEVLEEFLAVDQHFARGFDAQADLGEFARSDVAEDDPRRLVAGWDDDFDALVGLAGED